MFLPRGNWRTSPLELRLRLDRRSPWLNISAGSRARSARQPRGKVATAPLPCTAHPVDSNLLRKEETLPVTTGEGERFFRERVEVAPVPLRGRAGGRTSPPGREKFLRLGSMMGLGLRGVPDEKGELGVVQREASLDLSSNLSLAL